MMWPIFWPADTDFSNPANTRHPSEDAAAAAKYIAEQVAAVVAASGTCDDPEGYGQAVTRDLFPDVLPYVIGTPASYGFAGFNGRTLADNAPEAMLSLVTGMAIPSGLRPATAQRPAHCRPSPTSCPPERGSGGAGLAREGVVPGRPGRGHHPWWPARLRTVPGAAPRHRLDSLAVASSLLCAATRAASRRRA